MEEDEAASATITDPESQTRIAEIKNLQRSALGGTEALNGCVSEVFLRHFVTFGKQR